MASLLYSIVNLIDGFIEFKILRKLLGLILFSSTEISQLSRKPLQFSKITFRKSSPNLFLQRSKYVNSKNPNVRFA